MKSAKILALVTALLAFLPVQLSALPLPEPAPRYHWECVPFAREVSGIQIYGDAWTWWDQAEGRYKRGNMPKIGAVLAFIPYGKMELGHVAAVSEIVDSRTILVTHANWSPINGRRGQVERDVQVIDVSEDNDWTAVRVWFGPNATLGGTAWPTHGFIYPTRAVTPLDTVELALVREAPKVRNPPRLQFADVLKWTDSLPGEDAETKAPPEKPTGRLAYLGKLLPKLK
jgi:surface antigen